MESNREEMNTALVAILNENFGDQVVSSSLHYDLLTVEVRKDRITEILRFLYERPETGFQYLTTLFGIHYPDNKAIAVVYQLHSLVRNHRVRLKVMLPEENPSLSTVTGVFSAANWMERETYDFFGVQFEGHPNLKRILNVEEMIIFPMRKEYPLEDQTREDKNDAMFGR